MLLENDIFMFDLDKTIWNTSNHHKQQIWAKQMLSPLEHDSLKDIIYDDTGSFCVLDEGIKEFLQFLKDSGKKIGFCTNGMILDEDFEKQPSIKMLKIFGIYDFFEIKILQYKDASKFDAISNLGLKNEKLVLFDDDPLVIRTFLRGPFNIISRYEFKSWKDIIPNE